ncbi:unnamed protein product [Polarella glacialis]|uniref:Uncharacterized protein n=1 Tax=Polarella glacialis TaxID=89957 RepID=A0A813JNZ8_POLGL|nr:unnamed protein product [Polarella glacialis]
MSYLSALCDALAGRSRRQRRELMLFMPSAKAAPYVRGNAGTSLLCNVWERRHCSCAGPGHAYPQLVCCWWTWASDHEGQGYSGKDGDARGNASSSGRCSSSACQGAPSPPTAAELHAVQLDLLYQQRRRKASPDAEEAHVLEDSWDWPSQATQTVRRELRPVVFSLLEHPGARTLALH